MKLKLLLLPLFLILILAGCSKVKDPEFRRISGFKVREFGLQDVSIGFQVTYFNPNNFGVEVKEAMADLYMDSVYMGKFSQDSAVSVSRNGEFTIPFSGKISLATALRLDLRNLAERKVHVRAEGSVKVGKAGIFVSRPFRYEGEHSISELNLQ